jgi:predicted nuclease of predicted toxin-antitoxin system
VKLWFDEDLSPTLVQVAAKRGFVATCNRDRGMLGATDPHLRRVVRAESFVFVTDNASDFRPMYERDDVHPGLVVLPGTVPRRRQQELARIVIDFIVDSASHTGAEPAAFMVNKLVGIDERGVCAVHE